MGRSSSSPSKSATKPEGAPSYMDMITQAVVYEAETNEDHGRKGCSLQFIKKYLEDHYNMDPTTNRVKSQIKRAIEKGIETGVWVHPNDNIARIKLTPTAKKDETKMNKAKIQSGLEDPVDMVDVESEESESELSSSPLPQTKKAKKSAPAAKKKPAASTAKKSSTTTTKKVSCVVCECDGFARALVDRCSCLAPRSSHRRLLRPSRPRPRLAPRPARQQRRRSNLNQRHFIPAHDVTQASTHACSDSLSRTETSSSPHPVPLRSCSSCYTRSPLSLPHSPAYCTLTLTAILPHSSHEAPHDAAPSHNPCTRPRKNESPIAQTHLHNREAPSTLNASQDEQSKKKVRN